MNSLSKPFNNLTLLIATSGPMSTLGKRHWINFKCVEIKIRGKTPEGNCGENVDCPGFPGLLLNASSWEDEESQGSHFSYHFQGDKVRWLLKQATNRNTRTIRIEAVCWTESWNFKQLYLVHENNWIWNLARRWLILVKVFKIFCSEWKEKTLTFPYWGLSISKHKSFFSP